MVSNCAKGKVPVRSVACETAVFGRARGLRRVLVALVARRGAGLATWPPREPPPRPVTDFGSKAYWDAMYAGRGALDGERYSWFCAWTELEPFWRELVDPRRSRVLVPGCGNDPTAVALFDAGWRDLTLFDYSAAAVARTRDLFGERREVVAARADARDLPFADASFDAVLDKGTLDVLHMTGDRTFAASVAELARVAAPGAVLVSLSRVVPRDDLLAAFDDGRWATLRDGSLGFTADGRATIDLGADLYAWRRR